MSQPNFDPALAVLWRDFWDRLRAYSLEHPDDADAIMQGLSVEMQRIAEAHLAAQQEALRQGRP